MPSEPTPRIPEAVVEERAQQLWGNFPYDDDTPWEDLREATRDQVRAKARADLELAADCLPLLCAGLEEERDDFERRYDRSVQAHQSADLEVDEAKAQLAEVRAEVEEIVRIYNDDSLSNSAAQDRTEEAARKALAILDSSSSLSGDGEERGEEEAGYPAWPPRHGQIWFDKQTGLAVGIGTVCRTELGERVSGTIYRYESSGLLGEFALPLQEFRERHHLLGDDPDAVREEASTGKSQPDCQSTPELLGEEACDPDCGGGPQHQSFCRLSNGGVGGARELLQEAVAKADPRRRQQHPTDFPAPRYSAAGSFLRGLLPQLQRHRQRGPGRATG